MNACEVKELAELLWGGGIRPNGCGSPFGLAARIIAGQEVGLKPVQSCNQIMVVNGRASIWGDAALALCQRSGLLEYHKEGVEGDGDDRHGWCDSQRKGGEVVRREFSLREAKKAGLLDKKDTPWQKYTDQMLIMRARSFSLRTSCADVLAGLGIVEEQRDVETVKKEEATAATTATPSPSPLADKTSSPEPEKLIDGETLAAIADLKPAFVAATGVDWKDMLVKEDGTTSAKHLRQSQAIKLLAKMRAAVDAAKPQSEKLVEGLFRQPADTPSGTTPDEKCSTLCAVGEPCSVNASGKCLVTGQDLCESGPGGEASGQLTTTG